MKLLHQTMICDAVILNSDGRRCTNRARRIVIDATTQKHQLRCGVHGRIEHEQVIAEL